MTRWPNKREAWPVVDDKLSDATQVLAALDTHGAPPGLTVADRIRAWAERERAVVAQRDSAERGCRALVTQRDEALERTHRAEADLGEYKRQMEDALTAEAAREREACALTRVRAVPADQSGDYKDGWFDALIEKRAAIRARGRE